MFFFKIFFFTLVRPHILLHPGPHYAAEGNNHIFTVCHVTGNPTPVVTWRKSAGQLPQGRVEYNNSALRISHVRKDDSGAYFCSAVNRLGKVEGKTVLVVVSLPQFTAREGFWLSRQGRFLLVLAELLR